MKCDEPRRRGGANLPSKRTVNTIGPKGRGGGRGQINYDNNECDEYDDDDGDDDDYEVFFFSIQNDLKHDRHQMG